MLMLWKPGSAGETGALEAGALEDGTLEPRALEAEAAEIDAIQNQQAICLPPLWPDNL